MRRRTRRGKSKVLALVQATQMVAIDLDDSTVFPTDVVTDDRLQGFYDGTADDDQCIGGEPRTNLAKLIRELRQDGRFREAMRSAIRKRIARYTRNPERWGLYEPSPPRLHPTVVHRKATPAKRHPNCAYCGSLGDYVSVCGRCAAEGVDGPVIRGTAARKATTYTIWR